METPEGTTPPGGWEPAPGPTSVTGSPPVASSVPWEDRSRGGRVAAFWRTVTMIITSPTRFYRALAPQGDYGSAILFALVVGLVSACTGAFWSFLAGTVGFVRSDFAEGVRNYAHFWLLLAVSPALILFELVFWSLCTHLFLLIADAGHSGLKGTLRTIAYAQAPALLSVIPVCGGIVGAIWSLVLQIIGLAEIHRTSRVRSSFATLFPIFICGGLISVLVALGVIAGVMGALGDLK